MELISCIEALKAINNKTIPTIVTMDSQYVVKGINEWIYGWLKKNWKTASGKHVENRDLWEELLGFKETIQRHRICANVEVMLITRVITELIT